MLATLVRGLSWSRERSARLAHQGGRPRPPVYARQSHVAPLRLPADKQQKAVDMVIEQAEAFAADWSV